MLLACGLQPVVSTDEMRLVFDYIDNFQGGDGLIEYGEMETAFRRCGLEAPLTDLKQAGVKHKTALVFAPVCALGCLHTCLLL